MSQEDTQVLYTQVVKEKQTKKVINYKIMFILALILQVKHFSSQILTIS